MNLRTLVTLAVVAGCAVDELDPLPAAQAPAPRSLGLTSTPLVGGADVTLRVTGALPRTNIYLFRSNDVVPNGYCPAPIAPDCLDLRPPVTQQLTLRSDAAGVAEITFRLPDLPAMFVGMQAGYLNPPTIDTSNPLLEEVHPRTSDYDNDGLTAWDEVMLHGTWPGIPDSDGGGLDDGAEIAAGLDPLDPTDDGVPDTQVVIQGAGGGVFVGATYTGTETWTWTGATSGLELCRVTYTMVDQASYTGPPPGPGPQSQCIGCVVSMGGVAYDKTELTPPGQCAANGLPLYAGFPDVWQFGYGFSAAGTFYEYLWAQDLWVPNYDTAVTLDPLTSSWSYVYETTMAWSPPSP